MNELPGMQAAWTRRQLIGRGSVLAAVGVAMPSILAACGSDTKSSSDTTAGGSVTTGVASSGAGVSGSEAESLAVFDPTAPKGSPSPHAKILGFPNPFDAELFLRISDIFDQVASERGGDFVTAISDGDPAKLVEHLDSFMAQDAGVLFLTPIEEEATKPGSQKAVEGGVCVFGVFRGFASLQVVEDQYAIGYSQGKAAVKWIKDNLGGEAEVAYFNEDMSASIRPRHDGVLAALAEGGDGIKVVSDVQVELTTEAGASAMNTILQAYPDVKVAMGGSGVIAGVYAAFDALGRTKEADLYLSSIAGGDDALDLIAQGTIYRATFGEPWYMWAYALAQFSFDWMEGKSIPRVISAPGGLKEISTPEDATAFKDAMSDPAATWNDPALRDSYISMYGNINYDTRDLYWLDAVTKLPS